MLGGDTGQGSFHSGSEEQMSSEAYNIEYSDRVLVAAYRLYNSREKRPFSIDHCNREDSCRLADYVLLVALGMENAHIRDLPVDMAGLFDPFMISSRLRKLRKNGKIPTRKRMRRWEEIK